jgi:hypothetical protein
MIIKVIGNDIRPIDNVSDLLIDLCEDNMVEDGDLLPQVRSFRYTYIGCDILYATNMILQESDHSYYKPIYCEVFLRD